MSVPGSPVVVKGWAVRPAERAPVLCSYRATWSPKLERVVVELTAPPETRRNGDRPQLQTRARRLELHLDRHAVVAFRVVLAGASVAGGIVGLPAVEQLVEQPSLFEGADVRRRALLVDGGAS